MSGRGVVGTFIVETLQLVGERGQLRFSSCFAAFCCCQRFLLIGFFTHQLCVGFTGYPSLSFSIAAMFLGIMQRSRQTFELVFTCVKFLFIIGKLLAGFFWCQSGRSHWRSRCGFMSFLDQRPYGFIALVKGCQLVAVFPGAGCSLRNLGVLIIQLPCSFLAIFHLFSEFSLTLLKVLVFIN